MEDTMEQIEEQIRDAEPVKESEVRLDNTEPLTEMTPVKMQSAGYVYIYDTRTGERSVCNRNMLPAHLGKRRADGSIVFTTRKPQISPKRGTLKCILHPSNPNRGHYDELGLPTCPKATLASPYQVSRHMQKRHKMEWATIEAERVAKEKEEEREFRQNLMGKQERPLYVKEKK
jgi:hypothetical protein